MSKKAIIFLTGGLGNQLFQYAFSKYIHSEFNIDTEFNTDFYYSDFKGQTCRKIELNLFKLEFKQSTGNYFQRKILRIKEKLSFLTPNPFTNYFSENNLNYKNLKNITLKKKNFFRGYWQNYKYFESVQADIKKDFSLSHNLKYLDKITYNKIIKTNSVCVHVRRSDFIDSVYDVVDEKYYKKAYKELISKFLDLECFIFSDDIDWCIENLSFIKNSNFCSFSMINDFHLMSLCKHFIIPNSTFSWWAAFLSNYKEKNVLIPSKWHQNNLEFFNNSSPKNWIKIKND
ncbi:MAG: hypothetical protein CMC86_05570 [Flavobacteriaceae bacterium]|nr:hypothetical protein [Flavobacteriaceae bacterium]|tara:strand:+ start:9520 stop:10380 length:861 start_codon:yes stop_codon:yes gene_type:complete